MVYNPPMTKLLQQAKEKQYAYSNGLGMLVGQAARSLEIWTGSEISENAMRQGAKLALS
jgi:shikimate dehydrogenase